MKTPHQVIEPSSQNNNQNDNQNNNNTNTTDIFAFIRARAPQRCVD